MNGSEIQMIDANSPKVKLMVGLLITALMLLSVIGLSYADSKKWSAQGSCPYDNVTGNYTDSDGNVSAYGTMESAYECAFLGLLPKVVQDRLGSLGDAQTKKDAELILKLNSNARK